MSVFSVKKVRYAEVSLRETGLRMAVLELEYPRGSREREWRKVSSF